MKKKVQKSKNGKQLRMPLKKTIELPQQMDEDKKVYNLRVPKKKTSKNEVCESTETPPRKLRTRNVKNYSLKVVKSKNVEKKVNTNSPAIVDSKRVPIYKTLVLVEEKVQNPEEIYEFISDDLPSDQKIKKRKKFRKPSVKQTKKLNGMQYNGFQKTKIKSTKNVSKNVQLKQQEKQTSTKSKQNLKRNVYANVKNTGYSKNIEASTNIVSNQRPQQSSSNAPDSPVISPLNTEEDDMSNHSLIRQSISPISKTVDNLIIESPRNSTDSFSQVQNVVQSTPQINRSLASQEKKTLAPMNLNKKSIDSEDKIHISSMTNKKLTSQDEADVTQIQKENVSPRKFGTVISNLNSVKNATTTFKQSSLQQQQLPTEAVLPLSSFENDQPDQEMQDDILPESSLLTEDNRKVNNTLSSNKSSKTKIDQLLNPLRFEYIMQSFKQKVSSVSKFKAENSKSQKENKNPELVPGPSNSEKSKAIVLRQSNLNNFLNLDEMPNSTRISTVHGIFDDGNNSPISGKKPLIISDESNVENEFGLKNIYSERSSPIKKKSVPIIATARDVARSVKGKLFVKARVKSCLTRRVPENMTKKTLLKNIFKKSVPELKASVNEMIIKESEVVCKNKCVVDDQNKISKSLMNNNEKNTNIVEDENENILYFMENENENNISFMEIENENNISFMEVENEKNAGQTEDENEKNAGHTEDENEENAGHTEDENEENAGHTEDQSNEKNTSAKSIENFNVSVDPKTAYLVAISFSDTFDLLSKNGDEVSSKIPDEIPLFVDLEPVHFSQPPRRSYKKSKKEICFNTSRVDSESNCSEEDDYEKPKKKRKKVSRLNKEEQKRMQQWIKTINETFNEIEQFNLTIE